VIDRRAFILATAGGLLAAPLIGEAQQAGKVPRIGYLLSSAKRPSNEAFWEGLRALGYIEGQNIITERRYAEGKAERYADLAAELVRLRVDVIVADSALATRAAQQATTSIPVVMIAADPEGLGLIASLGHPGGNVTGLSTHSPELMGKRLELVREALPRMSRVAVLANAVNPAGVFFLKEAQRAASSLGMQIHIATVRTAEDFDRAFVTIAGARPDVLLVIEDPTLISFNIERITSFAGQRRLPTITGSNTLAKPGILMVYGPSFPEMYRRTAFYVDRILKGANPAELPVEQPTKFELIINLKTARALGLTIPPSLLSRADEVIQ
jgi:putative ABC transport system substrate-binding protein